MGYHLVDPDDVAPFDAPGRDFRQIGAEIGLETLGINHVVADPGEQIPLQYHYHEQQEEAFYVIDGELHVETPDQTYVVEEGNLFVAQPERPHRAFNPEGANAPVEVLAVGAPADDDARPHEPGTQ